MNYKVMKPFTLNSREYKPGDSITLSDRQAVFQELKGRISTQAATEKQIKSDTKEPSK